WIVDGSVAGKVAAEFGGGGHEAAEVRCPVNSYTLVVAEYVPALLFGKKMGDCERSANSASELIPAERADGGKEEATGVEGIVAQKFPAVAVPLVRAGFGHQVFR